MARKLEDIKADLIAGNITDETLEEFHIALRRSKTNWNRIQHCYTTAYRFPKNRTDDAVKLIRYGIEHYPDSWFTLYSAHLYIGHICESAERYGEAKAAYLQALAALPEEEGRDYIPTVNGDLMWVELHLNNFRYTDEFKAYYDLFMTADSFEKSVMRSAFHIAVAETVICMHTGDTAGAKAASERARTIMSPGFLGKLYAIMKRHRISETAGATPQSVRYLSKTAKKLKHKKAGL